MAKVAKNITIPQGSDFSKTFTSLESDGSVTNLTGYSAEAKLKKHSEALVSHSFTVGITSATGQVSIAMTSGVTTPLDSGRYYYDIRLTSSSEAKLRLAEGMALVTAGIST